MRALDLARSVDEGDLSPSTLATFVIEAVADRDGAIGAFAHFDPGALELAARAARPGELFGVPIGVKDIIDTADWPTEYGSALYAGHRPKADAAIITMARRAGGVVAGKTVTTEFAFLQPGKTRNPHDGARTPGGSSSGSAAAVAAGLVPLALGTQTAGSVLRPASYCGVAAIKPSFRLLPTVGVKTAAWTLDTLGLFGARVEDIAFGLAALTKRNLRVDGVDFGHPTFGLLRQDFAGPPDGESEAALEAARKAIENQGGRIVSFEAPAEWAAAHAAQPTLMAHEIALALGHEHAEHRAGLSDVLLGLLDHGAAIDPESYDEARRTAHRARRATRAAFEGCDALLTFAAPGIAPGLDSTGDPRFNRLFTMLGTPAVAVPGYNDPASGMPVGVQVVGAFGDDHRALAAAAFAEKALRLRVGA